MRTFTLNRQIDDSGISGTGRVAEGIEFSDGTVALRWCAPDNPASTVIWPDINAVIRIHGHGGHTQIVFDNQKEQQ